jgi:glycosyltransferase involved in cell wall biosynthesis
MPALRVTIVQPALPKYRVPVFAELAKRVDLRVIYGTAEGAPPNVRADSFKAVCVPERSIRIGTRTLFWHRPQWDSAEGLDTDVLILTWSLPCLSLGPALLRARKTDLPTVLWGHGYSKLDGKWRDASRLAVARLATAALFYNQRAATRQIRLGLDPAKVFVAHNALDQQPIQDARATWLANPEVLDDFRRQNGILGVNTVLFVSRLEEDNRVDLLIRAVHRVQDDLPETRLVIIGDGPARESLEGLVEELGLQHSVVFAGKIYDEMKLAPWFLSSDVFCYPQNIGLSVLHAFGYGVPVVTSDRVWSQNPEMEAVEDNHNALLYPHGDLESLARALRRLLVERELRSRLAANARRTGLAYSISRMVDGMEAAITYAAGCHHPAA